MDTSLDELYLTWLYEQVGSVKQRNRSRTYWSLLGQLHDKEFVWLIPNDDNRVEDGHDLRYEFMDENGIKDLDADAWMPFRCSMLELLVTTAKWLSFEAGGEPSVWFWHLIDTLEIRYSDRDYNEHIISEIDIVLNMFINRSYAPDGRGGLFPLENPHQDQRNVELWYQLNAYLIELN